MKLNYLYLLPIMLTVYLIFSFTVLKVSIEEKIRKIYYCIVMFLYVIIINNINVNSLVKGAPFNLSSETWGVIIYTIFFYIVVMIIDTNLISGSGFNEVGFLGAFFKKNDKKIIAVQSEFSKLVSDQVFAQSSAICYLKKEYTKDKIKALLTTNQYNYAEILKDIICKYYDSLNIQVILNIELIKAATATIQYEKIKADYKLSKIIIKKIEKYHNEGTTYYVRRKTDNIAFITVKTDIIQEPFIIIVKSSKDLNIEVDERIFECIISILDITTMLASV